MEKDLIKYAHLWEGRHTHGNLMNTKKPEAYVRYHFLIEHLEDGRPQLVIVDTYLAPAVVNVTRFTYDNKIPDNFDKKDHLYGYAELQLRRMMGTLKKLHAGRVPGVNVATAFQ